MKKSYIPVIFDTAFFAFAAFLVFLSLLIRTVKSPFQYIFSALFALFFAVFVFAFLFGRKNKSEEKKKQKELAELALFHLSFMKKNDMLALFTKAFNNCGKSFKKVGNFFYVAEEKTAYLIALSADGAGKADVVKLYNAIGPQETGKIFCLSFSRETEDFCAKFCGRIVLLKAEKTYDFLKENDALPEIKIQADTLKKRKFGFKIILNKKKAKNYLVFGLIFTAMSFIARYKYYYLAAGCFFLILSAITIVFGKSEPREN